MWTAPINQNQDIGTNAWNQYLFKIRRNWQTPYYMTRVIRSWITGFLTGIVRYPASSNAKLMHGIPVLYPATTCGGDTELGLDQRHHAVRSNFTMARHVSWCKNIADSWTWTRFSDAEMWRGPPFESNFSIIGTFTHPRSHLSCKRAPLRFMAHPGNYSKLM